MSAVLVTTPDVAVTVVKAAPGPVGDGATGVPAEVAVDHGLPVPKVASIADSSYRVDLAQGPATARSAASKARSVVVAVPVVGDGKVEPTPVGLVDVHVRDEKVAAAAGGAKVAFTVAAVDAKAAGQSAAVTIDYSSFANAFGGVWSQRLVVLQAPACALTTPRLAECQRRTPVVISNDWRTQTLSMTVPVDTAPQLRGTDAAAAPTVVSADESDGVTTAAAHMSPLAAFRQPAVVPLSVAAGPGGGPVTYVLSSAAPGGAGTFVAPPLAPSSSWDVGLGSGSFDYSFPVPMVPAPHGGTPSLGLSYSSQKMDGLTVTSNPQPGPAGLGWDLSSGFIERRFKPCVLVGGAILDECSYGDNAVLTYAGHSSELVKTSDTSADESEWQLQESPRWRVTRFSGTLGMSGNGDNDGAWWRVITDDGTVTTFGRNTVDGDPTTLNSVLVIPVTSIDSAGPCYSSTDNTCPLAWRWMADSVTDTNNNAQTYFYEKETNYYGAKGDQYNPVQYDMAARLTRIEYGETVGGLFTTSDVGVTLSYEYRCIALSACDAPTHDNGDQYPDTPNDLICDSVGPCDSHFVTYFTAYRLVAIDTWSRTDDVYSYADRIQLTHDWTCTPDTTNPGVCDVNGGGFPTELYLRTIQRLGSPAAPTAPDVFPTVGGLELPAVRFDSTYSDSTDWTNTVIDSPFANRADATPTNGVYPQYIPRITQVRDELGSITLVTYGQPSGCIGLSDAFPATGYVDNGTNCFPQWTYASSPDDDHPQSAGWGLYNKFVVTKITVRDMTPDSTDQITRYYYPDSRTDAAYRYSDSRWQTYNTYSEWRGYSKVIVRKGDDTASTQTRYLLFRGMNGDLDKNTGLPRAVTIDGIDDDKWFSGIVRQTRTMRTFDAMSPDNFDTATGETVETSVVNTPVVIPTGSSEAHLVDIGETDTYTNPASASGDADSSPLTSSVVTTFGAYTEPETITESGYNTPTRCRRLDYAILVAADIDIIDRVRGNRLYDGDCDLNPNTTEDLNVPNTGYTLAASTITYFDGHSSWDDAPTAGNPTRTDVWTGTTNLETLVTYDARGRAATMTDPNGNLTSTAYDTTVGPYQTTTVTNPKGWTTVTTTDPRRGTVLQTVDANSQVNHESYDGLGRITAMWRDGLTTATTPSVAFQYNVHVPTPPTHEENALPVPGHVVETTTTQTVSPLVQIDSFAIVDSLGRTRQTQTRSPTTGKLIITGDTTWDARGLTTTTWQPYSATAPTTLTYMTAALAPASSRPTGPITTMDYDQLGRTTTATQTSPGETTMATGTSYDGWNSTIDPPGLTAGTRTEHDAYGRTTKTVELDAATSVDAATTYAYTSRDETATIKDNSNYTTTMTYDWAGRRTNTTDPNAGASGAIYDNDGNVTSTTDARNTTLTYNYDNLNRQTAELSGATTLAQWAYDPTGSRGQLASSTRNDPVRGAYTTAYTYDAQYWITQKAITLPASETPLNGTYTYTYTYDTQGKQLTVAHPATGGLAAETVTTGYDALGNPNTLTSPAISYLSATTRNDIGQPTARSLGGITGGTVTRGYAYDGYQRLQQLTTSSPGAPATYQQNLTYRYDPTGNIASIADNSATGGAQRECFTYDTRARLTLAYTTTNVNTNQTCGTANTSGPDPYTETDSFDALGRMTAHFGATYTYGDAAHPYAPTSANGVTYTYNQMGAAVTRTTGGQTQTLAWDAEARLASVSTPTCTGGPPCVASNIYDADGQRLIRRNTDGTATAYLTNGDELTKVNATTKTEQRTYTSGDGTTLGVRTTTGYNTTTTDHHGTPTTSQNASGTPTVRRFKPYGVIRGAAPAWPNDHTYLNQPTDPSSLDYLNNRYYDPITAIFVSVDPLAASSREPYLYSRGNPVYLSDPSGLEPGCGVTAAGGSCAQAHAEEDAAYQSATPSTSYDRYGIVDAFHQKTLSSISVNILRRSGVGTITIDLYIAASQAGIIFMHDEGNGRGHCTNCPIQDTKVRVTIDFDTGTLTATAAPSCDKNGNGCFNARGWQLVARGDRVDNSLNNLEVDDEADQLRVQIRAKNARREDLAPGASVSSIDDVYRYTPSTRRLEGRGDRFPSETIYQTLNNQTYTLSTFDEQVDFLGVPYLSDHTWKGLSEWDPA